MEWEKLLCAEVRDASPTEAWVRLGGGNGSGLGPPREADAGALVWSAVVVSVAVLAWMLMMAALWSQSVGVNLDAHCMENLVGISEAYLRSRALQKGVPEALLSKEGLTPVAVEEPEAEPEPEEEEEVPGKKKKKKKKTKKTDGEGEDEYGDLSIGSRLPDHAK